MIISVTTFWSKKAHLSPENHKRVGGSTLSKQLTAINPSHRPKKPRQPTRTSLSRWKTPSKTNPLKWKTRSKGRTRSARCAASTLTTRTPSSCLSSPPRSPACWCPRRTSTCAARSTRSWRRLLRGLSWRASCRCWWRSRYFSTTLTWAGTGRRGEGKRAWSEWRTSGWIFVRKIV